MPDLEGNSEVVDKAEKGKKVLSEEELTKLVNGAREGVKNQLNPMIDKLTIRAENAEKELNETKTQVKELASKIEKLGKVGKSEDEINKLEELTKKMDEQKRDYEGALKAVSEEATDKIMRSELKAFKAEALKESGLKSQFARMVSGNTNEEILASIASAKDEQTKFLEEVEKELAKKIKSELPTPLAPPDNNDAPFEDPQTKLIKDRESLKHMSSDKYEEQRKQLLDNAWKKVLSNKKR